MSVTPSSKKTRKIYPVDLSDPDLQRLLAKAKKRTKITNQAELVRLGLTRGLAILIAQLEGGSAS